MKEDGKIYFPELNGVRTFACLMVLFSHTSLGIFKILEGNFPEFLPIIRFGEHIFCAGGQGVAIFFVLSGFLISYLLLSELNSEGRINVYKFYLRRIFRIWPLYYAIVIGGLFVYPYLIHQFRTDYVQNASIWKNLFFLNNFDLLRKNIDFDPQIQITWSVAIEEQFYFVWPLLFLFKSPKKYLPFIFATLLLINIWFFTQHKNQSDYVYFHTLGQIHNLVWGGICAYLLFYYSKTKDFFSRLSNSRRILFYLIGILVFAFRNELVVVCGSITIKYILMVFYSFIIIDQSFSLSTKFKFPRNGKFVQYGKYTYSLYLIHPSVLVIFKNLFDFISSRGQLIQIFSYKTSILSAFLLFVITVVSSIYVATISYKYYESKFLRIKERFSVL